MINCGLYNRFDADYETRVEHAKIGCMGEIAFEKVLRDYAIDYNTDRENFENRNADEFDFKINGYKIDVKVAKTNKTPNDRWTYGYPEQQTGMEKDIIVVGWVNEEQRRIGIYGWLRFNQICRYPLRYINTYAGYRYQTPNYEFRWGDLNKDLEALFEYVGQNHGR
jgi:hypothetical protein